jgi:predicted transcriptional regulator
MPTQTIMLELPEDLYRTVSTLARVTKRPLTEILQANLAHTLPPLDDVPVEEAEVLAHMSTLDDAALWQASNGTMSESQQAKLQALLDDQNAGTLPPTGAVLLQELFDTYGRLLVRQSHAWLLLARRGYNVPPQQRSEAV